MLTKSWKKISPRLKLNRYFKEKFASISNLCLSYICVNLNLSRKSLFAIIYRKIMYNENFQRLFICALFIKQTTLANVEKISNLYKIFYAHLPWLLIFLIFTDTSCIQITQYFLPVKILCISKKKKKWQTLDPAPIFEISIRIFVRCKIRGERKTHRMGNK